MSYLGAVNGLSAAVSSILALSAKKYWSPLNLFALGEKGAWFDPSDIRTLFQDSAGTTPVTAVEQPVGKMLDKSGNGKDALQATAGNRPTYRARYNLLTFSEQFDNAAWVATAATITANQTTAPDGSSTADLLKEDSNTAVHFVTQTVTTAIKPIVFSVYAKQASGTRYLQLRPGGVGTGAAFANFDLTNGIVVVGGSGGTALTSATITSAGNGWYRCVLSANYAAAPTDFRCVLSNTTTENPTYSGDNASGVYLWGADLRYGTSTTFPYQSITTATSYNAVGFLPYLAFNGTSSAMATAAIDLSATNKMSVFNGVTQSASVASTVATLGTSTTTPGMFLQWMNSTVSNEIEWFATGNTTPIEIRENGVQTPPYTRVVTSTADLTQVTATTSLALRINGAAAAVTGIGTPGGVGTFANAALSIGAFNGANFLNGNLYGLIVRGASSTAAEIASTESWMNARTGAF